MGTSKPSLAIVKRTLLRGIRSLAITAVAGWWASRQNDPRYLGVIPIFATLGKLLREKYPNLAPWIPF